MIQVLAIIGFVLSAYALYVKYKSKNKNYKALCDINDHISCTKAFSSKYGSLTGLPNPLLGLFFYAAVYLFVYFQLSTLLKISVAASVIASIYLAYLSYIKQKNFCLVCSAIYVINFLMIIDAF